MTKYTIILFVLFLWAETRAKSLQNKNVVTSYLQSMVNDHVRDDKAKLDTFNDHTKGRKLTAIKEGEYVIFQLTVVN